MSFPKSLITTCARRLDRSVIKRRRFNISALAPDIVNPIFLPKCGTGSGSCRRGQPAFFRASTANASDVMHTNTLVQVRHVASYGAYLKSHKNKPRFQNVGFQNPTLQLKKKRIRIRQDECQQPVTCSQIRVMVGFKGCNLGRWR